MSETDLSKLKVADLKRELKNKGLSTTGNKNELIERLQNASGDGGVDSYLLDDPLDHDDLLSDEELDEKDLLADHEDELLNPSPETKPTPKPAPAVPIEVNPAHKKVSLKRNLSIPAPPIIIETKPDAELATETTEKNGAETEPAEPPKKVAKLVGLTVEERQKIRAEKFGGASITFDNTDEKKLARAARFGISADTPTVDIEVLKKRAERFGTTTATQLNQVEQEEKKKKRQERFGIVLPAAAASETTTKTELTEKARQRLERFKTTA